MEKTIEQLLHDNASPHTATIVQQFFAKKKVAQFSRPPYSSDLISPPPTILLS